MSTGPVDGPRHDYVIVGTGAGGRPLGARLAQRGHRVLLLEAGADAAAFPPPTPLNSQVPALHARYRRPEPGVELLRPALREREAAGAGQRDRHGTPRLRLVSAHLGSWRLDRS